MNGVPRKDVEEMVIKLREYVEDNTPGHGGTKEGLGEDSRA